MRSYSIFSILSQSHYEENILTETMEPDGVELRNGRIMLRGNSKGPPRKRKYGEKEKEIGEDPPLNKEKQKENEKRQRALKRGE